MTRAGSRVCAHVDATGPKPASPTTSRSPKALSARRSPATASGCGSTMRILSGSGIAVAFRLLPCCRYDPARRDPTFTLIGQLDFEPVGALANDLELRTIFD